MTTSFAACYGVQCTEDEAAESPTDTCLRAALTAIGAGHAQPS